MVRIEAADEHGMVRCFICDVSLYWEQAVVAHYIKRRHMATRFLKKNVHPACKECNRKDEYDPTIQMAHTIAINEYDIGTVEELNFLKNKEEHYGKAGLTQMGEHFRDEFKYIKKNKGL
jgi:hypothetical protein